MSDTMTPNAQERRRSAADNYRADLIAAGAQGRASDERAQARQFEDTAGSLRADARQDAVTASRARPRLGS